MGQYQQWDLRCSVYFYKRAHEYPVLDRHPGSNDLELDFRWVCAVSCARKRNPQQLSLYCVHKLISIDVQCDLDLWPLTSKINRVHPLITVNMSCKFDKEICNGLVSIVFTSVTIKKVWLPDRQTHAHTDRRRTKWSPCAAMLRRRHKKDRQTPDKVIPMCRYASQATQKGSLLCLKICGHTIYFLQLEWSRNTYVVCGTLD